MTNTHGPQDVDGFSVVHKTFFQAGVRLIHVCQHCRETLLRRSVIRHTGISFEAETMQTDTREAAIRPPERTDMMERLQSDGLNHGPNISDRLGSMTQRAKTTICLWDARLRTLTAEPEKGLATAEYAVVMIAATGFAGLLVAILKSGAVKTLLTNLVRQALSV